MEAHHVSAAHGADYTGIFGGILRVPELPPIVPRLQSTLGRMLPAGGTMWAIIAAASVVLGSHVRTTDAEIGAVLADALEKSAVIRRLVGVIDGSNLLVYLARGDCPRPASACLMMAGGGPEVRYVRINFQPPSGLGRASGWHRSELSIAMAHELQHAVEIAQWPEVVDGTSLQAAYRGRGVDLGGSRSGHRRRDRCWRGPSRGALAQQPPLARTADASRAAYGRSAGRSAVVVVGFFASGDPSARAPSSRCRACVSSAS